MKRIPFIFCVILALCLLGQSSWATKAYVTDMLKVTIRSGPGTENKIIAVLSSGQPVEVLEEQEDWSHVSLSDSGEDKIEGWMLSQYLVTRLPWELQVKSLREENRWLKKKMPDIEKKMVDTNRREQDLTIKLRQNAQELHNLKREYDTLKRGASGYLELKETHTATQSALEKNRKDVQRLSKENKSLRSSQMNKWFAIGAVVLLCGLMIGLVVGRQQRKRKSLYY